mgnify:CR=1 FL=1
MFSKSESLLYEGKAKKIFSLKEEDQVLIEFKNDTTAFNAQKHKKIEGKGSLNCQISAYLFELLQSKGIPTHYLGLKSDCCMVAENIKIIPLEIVIRNIATGSLCRQTPIPQGKELLKPLLDIYYKDDGLGDPLLTEARLELLNLTTTSQLKDIEKLVREVNTHLKEFFLQLDLILVDFKLELGLTASGELVVADEISPDTCRIWDNRVTDPIDKILDKDRFRQDLGGVYEAYEEILKRIQGVCPKPLKCS